MKIRSELAIVAVIVFGLSLMAFSSRDHLRTPDDDPADFLILVQNTENGLKLKCEAGCGWRELSFSLQPGVYEAVDQYGTMRLDKHKYSNDGKLSSFLFTIRKSKTGIDLEGKEGTAWAKLSFSCVQRKCDQYIDEYGTTTKE